MHRRTPEAGGDRRRVHHRERRRLRRRVVLEPLSRRDVRHRGDGVPAAARRDRPHADAEVRHGSGDLRARAAHREDVRSLRPRGLLDAGDAARVGCRRVAVDHPHRPRRPDPRPLRRDGHRAAQPSEAARCAGYRDVRRPHIPHEPVGLRLHRRRLDRSADDRARRQARRHHRNRRDGGAVHRAARARRRRAVRLPAHTVVDRRARQPPDRPRVVLVARARLAAEVAHELRDAARLRPHGRGPGPRRMDRPRAGACRAACSRS